LETKRKILEEKIKEIYGENFKFNLILKKEEVKKSEIREFIEKTFNLELFASDEGKG